MGRSTDILETTQAPSGHQAAKLRQAKGAGEEDAGVGVTSRGEGGALEVQGQAGGMLSG